MVERVGGVDVADIHTPGYSRPPYGYDVSIESMKTGPFIGPVLFFTASLPSPSPA
jgi:hypothetical protein